MKEGREGKVRTQVGFQGSPSSSHPFQRIKYIDPAASSYVWRVSALFLTKTGKSKERKRTIASASQKPCESPAGASLSSLSSSSAPSSSEDLSPLDAGC